MNEPISRRVFRDKALARSLLSVSAPQHLFGFFDGTAFLIRTLNSLVQVCEDRGGVHSYAIDFKPGSRRAQRSAAFSISTVVFTGPDNRRRRSIAYQVIPASAAVATLPTIPSRLGFIQSAITTCAMPGEHKALDQTNAHNLKIGSARPGGVSAKWIGVRVWSVENPISRSALVSS